MRYLSSTLRLLILSSICFVSCTKSVDTPAAATDNTTAIITSATWAIGSFTQKTDDRTSSFSGDIFTFSSDGKVTVTGTHPATGTWSSTPPTAGYYGGPASVGTFTINLGNGAPHNKLTKSWIIIEQTSSSLKLDNKEPLENEHLVFVKK